MLNGDLNRYFIELQLEDIAALPRYRETELRREKAAHFISMIATWLKEKELDDKVAAMAITALGQVQITCAADVINEIRKDDEMNVATIRQGSTMFVETACRWNEAR